MTTWATPGPGQRFQSRTGGREGRDPLCIVAAGAATTVGAVFVPARRTNATSVALRLPQLSVRPRRRSVGKGTLVERLGRSAREGSGAAAPTRGGPLLTRGAQRAGRSAPRATEWLAGGATRCRAASSSR